jgi:GntR family transcriptional repressor for pyruvate dehydrogenase complex
VSDTFQLESQIRPKEFGLKIVKELTIQTIHRQNLRDEIVRQLENLVLNNELSVGDALPPERELASQLGVSRNILREAISTMVQKGLLEVRQGSGTFVASPTVELLRDSLSFFVRFNESGFSDLLEARLGLEVQIAELAARRNTQADNELLEACLKELELVTDNSERYIEADILFHKALAQAAKNEILQLFLDSIRDAMRENIRLLLERHPKAVEEAMHYHRQIARAVQEHMPEEARNAMRAHLESVRQELHELEALESQGNGEIGIQV